MAKQGKVVPARRAPDREPSVLLRSAESLGRVIGLLQRQLDGTGRRNRDPMEDAAPGGANHNGQPAARTASRARAQAKSKRKATSSKAQATTRKTAASSKSRSSKTRKAGSTTRTSTKSRRK